LHYPAGPKNETYYGKGYQSIDGQEEPGSIKEPSRLSDGAVFDGRLPAGEVQEDASQIQEQIRNGPGNHQPSQGQKGDRRLARSQGKQAEEQLEDAEGNSNGQGLKCGCQKESIFSPFFLRHGLIIHDCYPGALYRKKFACRSHGFASRLDFPIVIISCPADAVNDGSAASAYTSNKIDRPLCSQLL
jgi:hypothetical protein